MAAPDAPSKPRPRPCASCPYRRNAPSGVWDRTEYAKLPEYDRDMAGQPAAVFHCHQGADSTGAHPVCSGWLGHRDPADLLAVRLGIITGHVDPSCAEYTTQVPLFASGAEAAAHGTAEIETPGAEARAVIGKLVRKRNLGAA